MGTSHSTGLVVARADILSPTAQALIGELNAELLRMYPEPGACHFRLDAAEVVDGNGAFVVASRGGNPVGCGAVRRIDVSTGEIKRMYVRPDERSNGAGRAIVAALEGEARRLGLTRLVLETGIRQHAAMALYRKLGFSDIPPYGEYCTSALTSVCMEKAL